MIYVTATVCKNPNSKQLDMVLGHFATMDRNYRTPSQHSLRRLKIYTTLRKILLNGAYRLNAMCSLYNDMHNIFPSIWNLLHYLVILSAVVLSLEVIHPSLPGTILAQVGKCSCPCLERGTNYHPHGKVHANLYFLVPYIHIYICMSSFHVIKDNLSICPPFSFWFIYMQVLSTISLYMLDSRCRLICII